MEWNADVIVTLQAPEATKRLAAHHQRTAGELVDAVAAGLEAAAVKGADAINAAGLRGRLGLTPQHGALGLFGSVMGWMIDRDGLIAAVGVPANTPAHRYARMLEEGGTIVPKTARALAIPVSPEAERYTRARDFPRDLTLVPRPGRAPLLVEMIGGPGSRARQRWIIHYVLKRSVRIPGFGWFTRGVQLSEAVMADAMGEALDEWAAGWALGDSSGPATGSQ